ncbi:MAG: discoidin domain-containing protein, partial [Rhizobiales bacterium]|nr:discoidin domain-containing protein [Rhizobacter sp.]
MSGTLLLPGCGGGADTAEAGRTGVASEEGVQRAFGAPANMGAPVQYVRLEAVSEVSGSAWTSMAEFNLLDEAGAVIPRAGWAVSADSVETEGENGAAARAIDGDANTFWHTAWSASSPRPPHAFTVNLGAPRSIGGFKYLPRQGAGHGTISDWRFYTSVDGSNWALVAQGAFVANTAEKAVTIGRVSAPTPAGGARYVRLEALSEVNGNPWSSMAEFSLFDAGGAAIARTGWSVSADSAELAGENGAAARAIDGDPGTYWHTQWSGGTPKPPHTFTVDLGATPSIGGFKYLPRPGGGNGTIAGWRFYTSADGAAWTLVGQGSFASGADEKTVTFADASPSDPVPAPAPIAPAPSGQNAPIVL